jgi:D-alanyl-D-alanine carboxypeptidase
MRLLPAWCRGAVACVAILAAVAVLAACGSTAGPAGVVRTGSAPRTGAAPNGLRIAVRRSASAQGSDPRALLAALVHAGAPGAVALVRRGDRIQTFVAGVADLESGARMRAGLRFRVGSVSKTVVAALVLKLVAQGRVQLSDTIAHWLPGLVADGRQITVAELLEHRSGLADYLNTAVGLMTSSRHLGRVWTPRQLLGLIARHPSLFAPGTQFLYSNTDDLVLGMLIERVTHMTLQRYAQRVLFGPLGMRSTSFALGRLSGPYAHGYMPTVGPFTAAPGGLGDTERLNGSVYGAAASLVSTAGDLDRLFHALFTGQIIPRSLVRLMQATRPRENGPRLSVLRAGLGRQPLRVRTGMGPWQKHLGVSGRGPCLAHRRPPDRAARQLRLRHAHLPNRHDSLQALLRTISGQPQWDRQLAHRTAQRSPDSLVLAGRLRIWRRSVAKSELFVPAQVSDRVAQRAQIKTGGVNVLCGDRQCLGRPLAHGHPVIIGPEVTEWLKFAIHTELHFATGGCRGTSASFAIVLSPGDRQASVGPVSREV